MMIIWRHNDVQEDEIPKEFFFRLTVNKRKTKKNIYPESCRKAKELT